MPGGQLPEGLVTTNNETVGEEIGNVDRVDLEDVARLWRGLHEAPDMSVFPCPASCKY
jgi:hypothetical protein